MDRLPEKWCILSKGEEHHNKLLLEWLKKMKYEYPDWDGDDYYYHVWKSDTISATRIRDYDYTQLTDEQFKKYVLKMKEEQKEIVGYKLKKEFEHCKEAALKLSNTIGNWENSLAEYDIRIQQTGYIGRLKQAGVLDLWFEPVYEKKEKFKVDDWVKLSETANGWGAGSEICNAVVKLTEIKKEFYGEKVYFIHEGFKKRTNYNEISRLATPEEIKAAQYPQITINGYKAEFFDEYVKFGCQEISIDFLEKLYSLQNTHNVDITANKENVKKLVEYYRNKK